MASADYTLPTVLSMQNRWKFINDLTGGWESIVENNTELYLPKGADETDPSYKSRSKKATYFDYFNPTIDGLKGLIFQKPIVVNDDVPTQITNLTDDLDSMGNNLDTVIKKFTDTAMRKGLSFAYIDMQTKLEESVSQQEEEQLGVRPYIILIEPENVINYTYDNVDGNIILTQVTIVESVTYQKDRFEQDIRKQYRVLTIGRVEVFDENMELIQDTQTGLKEIPLVALNLDDASKFLEAKPPFYSAGKMNIRHYQVSTDTAWSSYIANVPMITMMGFNPDEVKKITVSANSGISSQNPDAKVSWLDFKGENINTNREVAKDYETQIMLMGLSVLSDGGQVEQTATETVVTTKQKQSTLNSWTMDIEDAVSKIFYYMGLYYNLTDGGTVEIDADILSNVLTAEEIRVYSDMVAKGQMDLETLYTLLQNNKKVPQDTDVEVVKENLSTDGLLTNNE